MLQRFNNNCWWPLAAFLLKIVDIVSSSGSSAGIVVSSHRVRTLKWTGVSDLYRYFKENFYNNLGNFWVLPRR